MAGDWLHGWWLALSYIKDHKTQVRCSAVSKEWGALCRTLPKLDIGIGNITEKEEAERFIRRALWGRSGLQELKIDYLEPPGMYSGPASESNILSMLRDISTGLKVLHLKTASGTVYAKIWSRLVPDFPQLQSLTIQWGCLPEGRLGISQQLRNLKKIDLYFTEATGSQVEQLVNCCPCLEILRAASLSGPVHISSRSLVKILLYVNPEEIYIEAPKLRMLRLLVCGPTTVVNVSELEELAVGQVESLRVPLQLDKLKKLTFFEQKIPTMSRLLSSAKNMKHLIVTGDYQVGLEAELRLEQLVPSQVEFLGLETDLVESLRASEAFQRGSIEDVAELMNLDVTTKEGSNLPWFGLKMAALNLRGLSRRLNLVGLSRARDAEQIALHVLSVIVQLLKCSPQLECLVVTHVGHVLGPLLSQVEDARYHVSSSSCSTPECVRARIRCLGDDFVPDFEIYINSRC